MSAQIPVTDGDPYVTASEFLDRYDARLVGQLLDDDGGQLTRAEMANHAGLRACLADASGQVESALFLAQRFTPADLRALTGNAASWLKRVVCDLALGYVRDRRGIDYPLPMHERALAVLDEIRKGSRVIPTEESTAAGLVDVEAGTDQDRRTAGLLTYKARHVLGTRTWDRPYG